MGELFRGSRGRVLLCGDHPWAGFSGNWIGWEECRAHSVCADRPVPRVRLDNGQEVLVIHPSQWTKPTP